MAATIQVNDIWITRKVYEDAERIHYENLAKASMTPLASEVAKARQRLIESRDNVADMLPSIDTGAIKFLEKQVLQFQKTIDVLQGAYKRLEERLLKVEQQLNQQKPAHETKQAPAQKQQDDDNVDLFASDSEEDEAAAKVREERLAAYNAKKAKKPVLIAKSNVILDVKPWDDETDMKAMEVAVRKIEADGLLWGAAKLVPLAYGIQKLQISCVVEDDKVSIDWLTEQIESLEDFVQSVDIAAFNKI